MSNNNSNELNAIRNEQAKVGAFSYSTFLGSRGGQKVVKAKIVPTGLPNKTRNCDEVTPEAALFILDHLDEFKAALIAAHKMTKREGELERLIQEREDRAKGKKSPKAGSVDDLDARIAAMD